MTWTVFISIVAAVVVKFLLSPPSALVAWALDKFELHPKLKPKDTVITFNETQLKEGEKQTFIDAWNEASFLEKHWIFPGNEKLFLQPDTDVIPFVIGIKRKKLQVQLFVYSYEEHIDVVKQFKKKVVSYRIRSEELSAMAAGGRPQMEQA
ncbi:YfmQ family protein [Peribacillus kribbensis]|uniref:YfmQ family protein n=1 Tax=Peribacillus kribbensis TaxID=356658 RepID=UPI0004071370|nr:YfmQ family protein [Peribacillus kribbensis]